MNVLKERLIKLAATGFGSGLVPVAPGTAGTLAGIPFFFIFSAFPWPAYLFLLFLFTGAAVYIAAGAEGLFGKKDSPRIVVDEITGFLWTMFSVPPTLACIFWGFILFRFFDIVKPFPVRILHDKLPGGYGVVGDDVIAGIYSNIALHVLIKFCGT
ncbi:MAG: phosphatidylglycerophosphatase A [Syntrophobacteraceae bacterium CG23_combo_of_CG06-09_8_20_14_all_50_8]|nr:MAG: phosphatidylglycerophosphatase A [Syntrophobacteraceae bacterium CG23_combo_of_CG06-09_8_20_14_all_50_8]